MIKYISLYLLVGSALFLSPISEGKIFNTSYVSFEIPENWQCKSFGTDWVCHSTLSPQEKEAMIIVTAKMANESLDNLEIYTNFLQQPRESMTRSQKPFQSKVLHTKKVVINNHFWVDGFHKESEIPAYYTRYIVTTCCEKNKSAKLAILATYSAHVNHYTKYASDFLKSINSLRVLNIDKAISKMQELGAGENLGSISSYMEDLIDEAELQNEGTQQDDWLFGLDQTQAGVIFLILISVLTYGAIKFRKKKKNRKNRK